MTDFWTSGLPVAFVYFRLGVDWSFETTRFGSLNVNSFAKLLASCPTSFSFARVAGPDEGDLLRLSVD